MIKYVSLLYYCSTLTAITDVPDKTSTGFIPNWNQCTLSNISSTAVNTTIMTCTLTKLQSDTVLK